MRKLPPGVLVALVLLVTVTAVFIEKAQAVEKATAPPEKPLVALFPVQVKGPVEGLAERFDKDVRLELGKSEKFSVLLASPDSASTVLALQTLNLKPDELAEVENPLVLQSLVKALVVTVGIRPRLVFDDSGALKTCEVGFYWPQSSKRVQLEPPKQQMTLDELLQALAVEIAQVTAQHLLPETSGAPTGSPAGSTPGTTSTLEQGTSTTGVVKVTPSEEAKALFEGSKASLKAGNTALAISQLLHAINLAPKERAYRKALGDLYASLNRYSEAIAQYRELEKLEPDSADVLEKLGHLYYANNQFQLAATYFDKALKQAPSRTRLWVNLGKSYSGLGNEVAALAAYKKAADLHVPDAAIYAKLGDAAMQIGETDVALKYFEQAAKLAPQDAELQSKLASIFMTQGSPDQCLDALLRLIAVLPKGKAKLSPQSYEALVTWMARRLDRMLTRIRQGILDVSDGKEAREELFKTTYLDWLELKRYSQLADKVTPGEDRSEQHAHFVFGLALYQESLLEYLLYIDTGDPGHLGTASKKASTAAAELSKAQG